MIRRQRNRIRISFSPILFGYIAILLLIVPLRLLLAAGISAAVHELFHIFAIRLMGISVNSINFGVRGTEISTQPMTEKQELVCAMAGPAGGILLLPFYRWIPAISLCAFVQSLYNLLPLYPTDGGRVLRCGVNLFLSETNANMVIYVAEIFTLSTILAISLYGTFWLHFGIIPLIFALSILLQSAKRK